MITSRNLFSSTPDFLSMSWDNYLWISKCPKGKKWCNVFWGGRGCIIWLFDASHSALGWTSRGVAPRDSSHRGRARGGRWHVRGTGGRVMWGHDGHYLCQMLLQSTDFQILAMALVYEGLLLSTSLTQSCEQFYLHSSLICKSNLQLMPLSLNSSIRNMLIW